MDTSLEVQPSLTGIRVVDFGHYIAGRKSNQSKLKQIPALSNFPASDASNEEQVQFLEEAIQTQTVDFWIKIFQEADLGCHRVDCLEDLRDAYLHKINSDASVNEWDDGRSISVIRMIDHPKCIYKVRQPDTEAWERYERGSEGDRLSGRTD